MKKISEMTRGEFLAGLFVHNVPAAPKPPTRKISTRYGEREVEDAAATATLRETIAKMLDKMDDERSNRLRMSERLTLRGRRAMYAGLYQADDLADADRLERPEETGFVPLDEIPASYKFRNPVPYGRSPQPTPAPAVTKAAVIRRRPDGFRQVLVTYQI